MSATFRAANTATTSAGTTLTITKPTGTAQGDLLIAFVANDSASYNPLSAPVGWVAQDQYEAANTWTAVYTKVAGSSEPSNYAFTVANSSNMLGAIVGYYGSGIAFDSLAINVASGSASVLGAGLATSQPSETMVAAWISQNDSSAITLPAALTSRATLTGSASTDSLRVGDYTGPTVPGASSPGTATTCGTVTTFAYTVSLKLSSVPLQPTLSTPANNSYSDISTSGGPFAWLYNTGGSTGGETAYNFRRKISGATYSFWNAGSGLFQSTDVSNTSSSLSISFSAGVWPDSNIYNWSVSSTDAGGQGLYASDFTINAQTAPTVSVTAPTGTITNTQYPAVTWTPSLATGTTQSAYRVVTYNSTQYGAGGFSPGVSVGADDSGVVTSSAATYTVVTPLPSATYRSYVQLTQTPGGVTSAWAYSGFTVATDSPQRPNTHSVYSTDGTTGCPRITITATTYDNLFSANDSSFEGGLGTTVAVANCTLSQSTTEAEDGTHSCRMSSSASGNMIAGTATGLNGYAVLPNTVYIGQSDYWAGASPRSCRTDIAWYDSGGSFITQAAGTAVTDSTSSWTTSRTSFTSPANAAFGRLVYNVLSTGGAAELHYIDEAGIFPGPPPTISSYAWTIGGFVGASTLIILRSDGVYVRQASPANPLVVPAPAQSVVVYDYEATPGVSYTYSATVLSGNFASAASSTLPAISPPSVPTGLGFWELDPTNYPSATNAQPTAWNPQNYEQSSAHPVLQQTTANVVASAMQIADMTASFSIFTTAIYTAFLALLLSQKTIFISDPFGYSYYFRLAPSPGGLSGGVGNKAHDAQLQASTAAGPYRVLSVTGIGQPRPAV